MPLWVVVGGQYGSEGKGKTAAFITREENIDICIRCGGPNSGHSFIGKDGMLVLLRQLPTGVINPKSRLLIPAGALVDLNVLYEELQHFQLDSSRVGIDRNAMVVERNDLEAEKILGLRERLSSTLCGVGSAVSRRVLRGEDVRLARDAASTTPWLKPMLTEVSSEANDALDNAKKVLVEGTQGFGLSLYHSTEYPKATSRDTSAAAFLSEVGLSPRMASEIVVVFRTYPIRVAGTQAGNLSDEISWADLREESGYPHAIEEFTSVTKRLRRVSRFDWTLAEKSVEVNRPTRIAITGLDYLNFKNKGCTSEQDFTVEAREFLNAIEGRLGVPVSYLSTGPALDEMFARDAGGRCDEERDHVGQEAHVLGKR